MRETVERIEYWENILDFQLGTDAFDSNDIDAYVKEAFADELKKPEVMARILGSRQKE